jgi:acetolactate synthase-1/2/3 large subunit
VGSGASKEVLELAEKLQAPVTTTLLGKGAFPETHELSVGMLGMHGTAYANKAVVGCDMIMAIGARWDDRITGKVSEFCPTASKIHIDIDPAEFGKIIQPDVSINGDARLVLQELIPHVLVSTRCGRPSSAKARVNVNGFPAEALEQWVMDSQQRLVRSWGVPMIW